MAKVKGPIKEVGGVIEAEAAHRDGKTLRFVLRAKVARDDERRWLAVRKLQAVFPGTEVQEPNEGIDVVLYSGYYSGTDFTAGRMSAETVNQLIAKLPDDPVLGFEPGLPMQLLVATCYPLTEDELRLLAANIDDVQFAAHAKPDDVYGRRVASLLVPRLSRRNVRTAVESAVREFLSFKPHPVTA